MPYNPAWIEKTELEELSPAEYYIECCEFLEDFFTKRPGITGSEVQTALAEILELLDRDSAERHFEPSAKLERLGQRFRFGGKRPAEPAENALTALFLFGMAGKALYFISKQPQSPQFEEEVRRFFEDFNQFRGNLWLFYTAGRLAENGFEIEFISESTAKTPDYRASKGSLTVFVEANARSQAHTTIAGVQDILWNVLHGDSGSGKQIKFTDAQYDPGLVVVDVSNCDVDANSTGLPAHMKLLPDAIVVHTKNGYVYDLSRDPGFSAQPENTGNVVDFAIQYFHAMAGTGRYHVRALLIGISLAVHENVGVSGVPKGAVMFVDSRYPQLALQELSRAIYLIDTSKPFP